MKGDEEETKPLLVRAGSQEIIPQYKGCTVPVSRGEEANQSLRIKQSLLTPLNNSEVESSNVNPVAILHEQILVNPDEEKSNSRMKVLGVVLVIMAGMSFTGSNIIQKFVVPQLTFWQLLATRAFIQTLVVGATCLIMHLRYRPSKYVSNNP